MPRSARRLRLIRGVLRDRGVTRSRSQAIELGWRRRQAEHLIMLAWRRNRLTAGQVINKMADVVEGRFHQKVDGVAPAIPSMPWATVHHHI